MGVFKYPPSARVGLIREALACFKKPRTANEISDKIFETHQARLKPQVIGSVISWSMNVEVERFEERTFAHKYLLKEVPN